MSRENKKNLIMREALRLFAQKGFDAVSMRDLADAAGISVSTIYHYYESKQALFQDMIRQANAQTEKTRDEFLRVLGQTEKVEREPFVQAGVLFVTGYLRHEKIDPLLRMLESERFHDAEAEASWQRILFSDPITHEAKVFDMLAARGEIGEGDAEKLAGEYHGIVTLGYFTGDLDRMANALRAFYDRCFLKTEAE
ncbi:MAG: TetR/AcrR family transcriptional regulator [Clostridia bacterium]|nr:TetR/AcrR family transcriptional regulator [Clostridia bacterium]